MMTVRSRELEISKTGTALTNGVDDLLDYLGLPEPLAADFTLSDSELAKLTNAMRSEIIWHLLDAKITMPTATLPSVAQSILHISMTDCLSPSWIPESTDPP